jgi:glutathione S-transferase
MSRAAALGAHGPSASNAEGRPLAALPQFTLVSHHLCPYVQRAAIVLAEKGVPYTRRYVDLATKPDWFVAVSPLGKTPVLLAGDEPLFESAVICEYLDETLAPRLHPASAMQRARERAWVEFGSAVLNTIAACYNAPDDATLRARRGELAERFAQVEAVVSAVGPWFAGERFGLVDAAFGPVFRYLDVFEQWGEPELTAGLPRMRAWRAALAQRPSVRQAVGSDYAERLTAFLLARGSALSHRIAVRHVPVAHAPG